MRISEAHSNATYWGCLMLPILMHASEMNKASSRGKNNNNKRMKRNRRNQGEPNMLNLANTQLSKRCPPSAWVLASVLHAQTTTNHKWKREAFSHQTTIDLLWTVADKDLLPTPDL